jgi:hypothetical protein
VNTHPLAMGLLDHFFTLKTCEGTDEYQKGHTGSNFSLDLRIVLFGSRFNLHTYLKMYKNNGKVHPRPSIEHSKT